MVKYVQGEFGEEPIQDKPVDDSREAATDPLPDLPSDKRRKHVKDWNHETEDPA